MASPSSIAANLSCLLFLARHRPEGEAELLEAERVFLESMGGGPLQIEATIGWLAINGQRLVSGTPGALDVGGQLLAHEVQRVELPAQPEPGDVRALARVLSAFPGAYATWQEMLTALGPAGLRMKLTQGGADLSVVFYAETPQTVPLDPSRSTVNTAQLVDEAGLIPPAVHAPPPSPVARRDPKRAARAVEEEEEGLNQLSALTARGRAAIQASDWNELLTVAAAFLDAAAAPGPQVSARFYRLELRRLLSRKEVAHLAGLAAVGDRREEAIAVLRQLGVEATDVLLELMADTEELSERRGYYSALARMTEGLDLIVHHLGHPVWYVARNAAELCGELRLTEAVPELAAQVGHADERVRKAVAGALHRIGTREALDPLARLLKDPAPAIRMLVAGNLDGDEGRALAMPLAVMLEQEQDPDVIREGLRALGRIGTSDALMALRRAAQGELKSLGRKQRLQAVESLALAGPAAVPLLTALQGGHDRGLAQAAGDALRSIAP